MRSELCVMSVGRPARYAKFKCTWSVDASHLPSPHPFPKFQSSVMSPALKNPRFIMKLEIRWVLFCFESIHTVSHSPSLGDFRGTLWGWILGTLTDLSGLHQVGLLPSENISCFLVNLPCSERGTCLSLTDAYIWGLQVLHGLGTHLILLSNVNIDKMLLRQLPGQVPRSLVMPLNFISSILALLSIKLE